MTGGTLFEIPNKSNKIKVYLVLSAIFHILLFSYFFINFESRNFKTPNKLDGYKTIDVSFIQDLPKKQIISEPKSPAKKPKVTTSLLAEKDRSTKKETIKKGDNPSIKTIKPSKPTRKSKNKPTTKKTTPRKTVQKAVKSPPKKRKLNLKLPTSKLGLNAFSSSSSKNNATSSSQNIARNLNLSLQKSGTNDLVKNIPDGEVTLLNAKANKFAVFVRRVATRVFNNLRSSGWQRLSKSEIYRISTHSVIMAKMDTKGKIISITSLKSSGSSNFDSTVIGSARKAQDPNPPASAVDKNGDITFVFHAKTWSQSIKKTSKGPLIEKRWIYLGTELK